MRLDINGERAKKIAELRRAMSSEERSMGDVLFKDNLTRRGLSEEELALLLQDDHVKRAVEEIAADPEAVARYADDAVVMGVLQALG